MRSVSRLLAGAAVIAVLSAAAWAMARPVAVDLDRLTLHADEGRLYDGDAPFTGVAVRHEGDALVERVAYRNGKKDGRAERWYANGTRSERTVYAANRRDGTAETWWPDGTRRSEAHYAYGVADGVQRQWYRSGALFKEVRLEAGQEAGLQRAWRENGVLYANYEARDGRIYGLRRATLCFELTDEQLSLASTAP